MYRLFTFKKIIFFVCNSFFYVYLHNKTNYMNYTREEIETWKGMLTEHEKQELKKFLEFIENNHNRKPVRIAINFEHKRFSDNTGFATLNVPQSKGRVAMMFATENLKRTIKQLLNIN